MKSRSLCAGLMGAVVLTVAACGSSSKSTASSSSSSTSSSRVPASPSKAAQPKMTAQEVATKLAPLGCVPTPSPASTAAVSQTPPVTALDCTVSGESITISEYQNKKQLTANVLTARGPGCAVARTYGVTDALLVTGRNWAVHWPKTASTAQAIENAIGNGAQVDTIHC